MKIPLSTVRGRFYVAVSMTKAFSSWDTLEDARISFSFLPKDEQDKVIGIVEVKGVQTTVH